MKSFSFAKTFITATLAVALLLNASSVYAGAELDKVRVGQKPDKTRVVFDIRKNHDFKVYKLNNPSRVVVDFYKTANKLDFKNKYFKDSRLYRVRVSDHQKGLRIVLDLHKNYDYNFFTLGENKSGAERLVVDLVQPDVQVADKKVTVQKHEKKPAETKASLIAKSPENPKPLIEKTPSQPLVAMDKTVKDNVAREVKNNQATQSLLNKDSSILIKGDTLVVAIDPGHGGKDVGAIGHNHVYEKNATLQMSRELKRLIDQQPGMRAILTRNSDVFIPLHERVKIAKKNNADIFISVHADAFHKKSVRGGSVYVLSKGGASSVMARLLAKSENASLQDIKLQGRDRDVAFALSDLTREANIRASRKLGRSVLKEMQRSVHMHKSTLQSAEFAVLKSIDMPSLLIETAFISNPSEARKLMSSSFQTKMASSIVRGLQKFVDGNAQKPHWGETLYVQYKVQPGDTLSEIASNYQVSTKTLKKLNGIKNANQLYVGKKMRIPLSDQVVAGL
ncbi:N-acetylmuramoyl-L-alanine amidase [Thiomicrorhabdus sp. ZW0627]|uniref:N-acetylmuramoyl-L-alanine amidase n=1 Tax=Thiomicrorhabdus sp. ZW0627 TaxID=3039774 RepID=UPI002436BB66|nr:N-acetylmuramoyl-L-alanine amidase [Thiomicrorhabdus sp. ZW0627]MDG6773233.1 N-acetylmuramoyl-L-alanine amidase [Thiomicrorhabdus sp. ZW0627]